LGNVPRLPWIFAAILLFASAGLSRAGTPPLPTYNSNLVVDVTNTVFAGGALGNGVSNSAAAIQAAISMVSTSIMSGATGGTVRVRAVGTFTNYLCGPITLKSHVNFLIDTNTTLTMLPMSSWPGTTTFLSGGTITDSAISGAGTIDGHASFISGTSTNWWGSPGGNNEVANRPDFIEYQGSKRVVIQGVTLQNPPTFHIMVHNNNNGLTIQNIRINTSGSSQNTDGIDLASTNVLIQGCFISDGDDNIQIGSSSALASDITITNCTFGTGHGLSIGQPTQDGVNNLLVSNCTWNGTEYGIKIKTDRTEGGTIQNLQYRDLVMSNINFAIAFYDHYDTIGSPSSSINVPPSTPATDAPQAVTSTTPFVRNVMISNLTATAISGNIAAIIWGLPEAVMTNITMYNVNISASTKTFCIYDAKGVQIINSSLNAPTTSTNTLTLYNVDLTVTNSVSNTNLVTLGGLAVPGTNTLAFFNARAAVVTSNVLGSAATITGSAGSITLGGSALAFNQSGIQILNTNIMITSASTFTFSGGTDIINSTLSGPGPLTLNLQSSTLSVQGTLSGFTGTLTITNGGTLSFNQGGNSWGDANATFDAGSSGIVKNHSMSNIAIALGELAGGSGSKLQGSDQTGPAIDTYVIGALNSNTTFAGTIADGTGDGTPHTVALTEVGSGTFTLSGANTYSGGTTVSNGTLLVNNTIGSGTGAGAVTVVSAATLGGGGIIGGPMSVDGTLALGNSSGTLTISNNVVVNGDATLQYQLGINSDLTVVSGNLTLGGTLNVTDAGGFTNGTYTLFTYGGALTYNGVTMGATPNTNFTYTIDTNTAGLVNLEVTGSVLSPSASFTASPTAGAAPLGVTFTDTSTGSITNLFWDFGDSGTTNTTAGAIFAHTYTAVGTYTVMLVASGPGGDGTNIQLNLITVLDPFVAWQLQYFGCTNVAICPLASPDADPLGKGMSNTNQFLAGINPTNSASALRIISATQQGSDVVITWTTAGAHTNAVQATAGDGSGDYATNFTDVSGTIILTGSGDATTNYTDAGGATNNPSRYYRVRLVP
jgi:autotransporter-associated beta strand protein